MPRPKKNNAAYFSHDADMRNDLKVKALRNKFGNDGYSVWCMMLEVLTDSNNFECKFDDLSKELLAADFNVTSELLTEVIYYSVILKLIVIDNGCIYCENHKKRFQPLIDKRDRDRQRLKESYEKRNPPKQIAFESDIIETSKIPEFLLSTEQSYWFEQFCMNNKLSAKELEDKISEFASWLQDGGFTEKSKKDIKEHFRNWFNLKKYGQKSIKRSGAANKETTNFNRLATEREIKSAI